MPSIFISYRRDDSIDAAGRIYDRLAAHFGRVYVFMDIDTIPAGIDFRRHLQDAVGRCDILLAVIGNDWLEIRHQEGQMAGQKRLDDPDDFVRTEIQTALDRKIPVVPVLVGRATMPAEQDLPGGLKGLAFRHAAEVRPGRDFHVHVDRLIQDIKSFEQHFHLPGAFLEVVQGPNVGITYELTKHRIEIGRLVESDVPVLDLSVSRYHAHLQASKDGWWYINMASDNPSFVNCEPIGYGRVLLKDMDRIRLGLTVLLFRTRS